MNKDKHYHCVTQSFIFLDTYSKLDYYFLYFSFESITSKFWADFMKLKYDYEQKHCASLGKAFISHKIQHAQANHIAAQISAQKYSRKFLSNA